MLCIHTHSIRGAKTRKRLVLPLLSASMPSDLILLHKPSQDWTTAVKVYKRFVPIYHRFVNQAKVVGAKLPNYDKSWPLVSDYANRASIEFRDSPCSLDDRLKLN